MRICTKCNIEKDESEFYKRRSRCKCCQSEDSKEYNKIHKKELSDRNKKRRIENPDYFKQYRIKNRNEILNKKKQHYKQNKTKHISEGNQRRKKRMAKDIFYKLRVYTSNNIYKALKRQNGSKQGKSIFKYLPYTMEELKTHIESQFNEFQNWDNWGPYDPNGYTWQLDHIQPLSSFNYTSMEDSEFKKAWDLSNLRPLESLENIKKGNKII